MFYSDYVFSAPILLHIAIGVFLSRYVESAPRARVVDFGEIVWC
jgi:hypothetical protein